MRRRRRQYLYVFECETPHGFRYNGYGNSLADMPGNCWSSGGRYRVNLVKR